MTLTTFYKELSTYLLSLQHEDESKMVGHVDLWRDQRGEAIKTPAVFVEFMSMPWQSVGNNVQITDTSIRLHIITRIEEPTKANDNKFVDKAMEHLQVIDKLFKALTGWKSSVSGSLSRTASDTERAPSKLLHHVETWRVTIKDGAAVKTYIRKTPDITIERP